MDQTGEAMNLNKENVRVGQRIKYIGGKSYWTICEIQERGVVVEHPDGGHKHLVSWTEEIETIIS